MKRIANLSIIVEESNDENITKINAILHEYSEYILGRIGIPDKTHNVNIISIALCASLDILNSLTGKLGKIESVSAKLLVSNKEYSD
jgi:putative iron-only hydrogenase system regulator